MAQLASCLQWGVVLCTLAELWLVPRWVRNRQGGSSPESLLRPYLRHMLKEWTLVAMILASLSLEGRSWGAVGLALPALSFPPGLLLAGVLLLALKAALLRARPAGEARGEVDLLPATPRERRAWVGVALTAGVAEELRFRGFLPWFFMSLVPGLPPWAAMAAGALLFGLGHAYKGVRGAADAALAGGLFAALAGATGSLLVPMAAHALADLGLLRGSGGWGVEAWRRRLGRGQVLAVDKGSRCVVFDGRPGARAPMHLLDELETWVLRAAERPRTLRSLDVLAARQWAPEEVRAKVEALRARGLLAREGPWHLGLAAPAA